MDNLKIIGFIRVSGFDHSGYFVTNAPINQYDQHYVLCRYGYSVIGGYKYVGTPDQWLSIDQLSYKEQIEFNECSQWDDTVYKNTNKFMLVFD